MKISSSTPSTQVTCSQDQATQTAARSQKPFSLGWTLRRPHRILATGFCIGCIPFAPGTWGSFLAWVFYLLTPAGLISWPVASVLVALAFVFGIWLCGRSAQDAGVHDHSAMVWDEMVAVWLVLLVIHQPQNWLWQLAGVLVFRFFDIVKWGAVRRVDEKVQGGFGVMLDDLIAALFSLVVMGIALGVRAHLG